VGIATTNGGTVGPDSEQAEDRKSDQSLTSMADLPWCSSRLVVTLFQGRQVHEYDSLDHNCVDFLRKQIAEADLPPRKELEVDVWLDSPGGSADAAYKLVLLLRHYGHRLRVVVPDYAKSAATLVALGADEIFMGPAAELGPLDAQIQYETEGTTISALDQAQSVEYVGTQAVQMALAGFRAAVRGTGLGRKDILTEMMGFASHFYTPMVARIDPNMVHRAQSQLRVAQEYAERLMDMREIKGPLGAQSRAVAKALVEEYPHHGFVISLAEAADHGLPVRPSEDYIDWVKVTESFDRYLEQHGQPVMLAELVSGEEGDG